MSAFPARCPHCQRYLSFDPISLRYRCGACDVGEAGEAREAGGLPRDIWRERGEAVGREAARLLGRIERWLRK